MISYLYKRINKDRIDEPHIWAMWITLMIIDLLFLIIVIKEIV